MFVHDFNLFSDEVLFGVAIAIDCEEAYSHQKTSSLHQLPLAEVLQSLVPVSVAV